MTHSRRMRNVVGATAACLVVLALWSTSTAMANFKFGEVAVGLTGPQGVPSRLAGAHPDLHLNFTVPLTEAPRDGVTLLRPEEAVKDVSLDLPPGLVGNSAAFATCSDAELVNNNLGYSACPVASEIGQVRVYLEQPGAIEKWLGVYNMRHGPNEAARFGFNYEGVPATIVSMVDPSDYAVTSGSLDISQTAPIYKVALTIWGVPADPSHDGERQGKGEPFISPGESNPAEAPLVPFLRAPTSCPEGGSPFAVRGDSWLYPGEFDSRVLSRDGEGSELFFEGCRNLAFEPSLQVEPTSRAAGSPSGLSVDLRVPQNESPTGQSTSDVRSVTVELPEGMTVSPSSASGLGACSEAQLAIGSGVAPSCPESSKIGAVQIETPLLEEELEGGVYLAKQRENPFGSVLALYMVVKGPGFYLKLPGKVETDPRTGRLTTSFSNTPQLPFEVLHLALKSGPRAPLAMPQQCGSYSIKGEMVPWSGNPPVVAQSTFQVDEGCGGGGFSPTLKAGTTDSTAGSYSPFLLRVIRNENEQNLSKIAASLPEGLLAKLAGVTECPAAQAGTGDCPASSQVGQATVAAGPGSNPIFVPEPGKAPTAVYLGGPYKGAPLSLIVKVPAQAGPFDLGTVVVRNALKIDPVTTQVTTESDPLPQILDGIPISYRDVRVEVNRPGFIVNPTSCAAQKVATTLSGSGGATASPSAPFAAVNCEALGLAPKLALKFSGAPTRRGGHPKLTATLTTRPGDSNLGRVQVTLPKTEYLENAHIRTVCTRVQYAANQCPAKSIYGYARAWTPLLEKPLEGPVYLRSSNHKLPDLVASLDGQIHIDLDGRISSSRARIRNTFDFVPDAPVSKFMLMMKGGGKGLLVNNTDLCKAKPVADVEFDGQNGKVLNTSPKVAVGGCGAKKGKKTKK
jgi:hypothetical protein